MFERKDKRRLYWLLDQLLEKKIDASTFCDEFYYSYDLELQDELTTKEENNFKQLAAIVSRFSEFEEDITKYPGVYFTEDQLREKAGEVKKSLTPASP